VARVGIHPTAMSPRALPQAIRTDETQSGDRLVRKGCTEPSPDEREDELLRAIEAVFIDDKRSMGERLSLPYLATRSISSGRLSRSRYVGTTTDNSKRGGRCARMGSRSVKKAAFPS